MDLDQGLENRGFGPARSAGDDQTAKPLPDPIPLKIQSPISQ